MIKFVGSLIGLFAVYMLASGAVAALSKPNLESSDILLIGLSLMFLAQFLMGITIGTDNKQEQSVSEQKL